jgi:hypothetical protein
MRDRAERYLLVTIAAFATTVAATRWFLDLSGYPTIGGGDLHVAHVLWGGLLLVIAVLLPMLFTGRRASQLSALLAGIGVGLFIDEVGKFLTTSNDYFYAPAAPIIYGGILLLVLVWLIVRKTGGDTAYDATQTLVEAVRDGIDGDLTTQDRDRLVEHMGTVRPDETATPSTVAAQLVATLQSPAMEARLGTPGWVASGRARQLLERWLPRRLERLIILLGMAWAALQAVVAIIVLMVWDDVVVAGVQLIPEASGRLEFPTEPGWTGLMLGIAVVVGLASAAAIGLALGRRERPAMRMALIAALVSVAAGDLVAFYAYQSTALASTVTDLLLLALIIDYRIRLDRSAKIDASDVDEEAA